MKSSNACRWWAGWQTASTLRWEVGRRPDCLIVCYLGIRRRGQAKIFPGIQRAQCLPYAAQEQWASSPGAVTEDGSIVELIVLAVYRPRGKWIVICGRSSTSDNQWGFSGAGSFQVDTTRPVHQKDLCFEVRKPWWPRANKKSNMPGWVKGVWGELGREVSHT